MKLELTKRAWITFILIMYWCQSCGRRSFLVTLSGLGLVGKRGAILCIPSQSSFDLQPLPFWTTATSTATQGGYHLNDWERRLVGVGRLLLGLLRLNHDALRIWNIRGNEYIFVLPRTRWFQSLAISSPTLLLLNGCLSGRSAETRVIAINPELFGWNSGRDTNDTAFDPPLLIGPNELLCAHSDRARSS